MTWIWLSLRVSDWARAAVARAVVRTRVERVRSMWFPSEFAGWIGLFFSGGGWVFLRGFLRIKVRRRGVLMVRSWCFVWLGLVPCCTFSGLVKYATIFQIYFQ